MLSLDITLLVLVSIGLSIFEAVVIRDSRSQVHFCLHLNKPSLTLSLLSKSPGCLRLDNTYFARSIARKLSDLYGTLLLLAVLDRYFRIKNLQTKEIGYVLIILIKININ